MRQITPINFGWKYSIDFKDTYKKPAFDDKEFVEVDIPHTNIELPYNCFNEEEYQFISCYRKKIQMDHTELSNKKIFIDFAGVMTYAEVFVNGEFAGSHKGGYTPFSIDATPFIRAGNEQILVVKVDSTERTDIPPFGNVIDYLTYGGIYRDVSIRIVNPTYIENLRILPEKKDNRNWDISFSASIQGDHADTSEITIILYDRLKNIVGSVTSTQQTFSLKELTGVDVWDIETPHLYTAEAELKIDGNLMDSTLYTFGFRESEFRPDGFYLNRKKIPLIGLNRHQSFPYVGYAMPDRVQQKDADILKYELGLNIVRTSHYPQSVAFLDRCDEIGLLVFEEIPGWQHIGDLEWQKTADQQVTEMIKRDWNHPSIIIWGVRINESLDNHDFYTATNKTAHAADPSRQTGGVRCFPHSELLEDVYTMNDFIHSGGKVVLKPAHKVIGKKGVPYIVTEYNGHMYPTKRFDSENRVREHALRHARVINLQLGDPAISGAIGWCAFDYNTHKDFGSGDKICYHGVMDMFRIPKYAAAAYRSQNDPKKTEPYMQIASLVAKGDCDASFLFPIEIFTNCESVKVYNSSDELIDTFYPEHKAWPHLPHPPIRLMDFLGKSLEQLPFSKKDQDKFRKILRDAQSNSGILSFRSKRTAFILMLKFKLSRKEFTQIGFAILGGWGSKDSTFRFDACINEKVAITQFAGGQVYAERLQATLDDSTLSLSGNTYDATRISFRLVDNFGRDLPYIADSLELSIEGPGKIMGPAKVPLTGGCTAVWVRTMGSPGTITVTAASTRVDAVSVDIEVTD
ncbi:MAG: glycoside hydrolase family 2 protein [Bacteroidetes bacterium]|nr:glycoside hydrolase family 2 protein [Bacteroidota bacterium]